MIKDVQTVKEKYFIGRASEAVLLFGMGLYIFVKDIARTMMDLDLPDKTDDLIFILVLAAAVIRLAVMMIENREDMQVLLKYTGAAVLVDIVYIAIYQHNQSSSLLFFALFTVATIGLEYTKVLKAYAVGAAMVLLPIIVMAWIGAVDNLVYIRDMAIRSAWGIRYPTDLISLLLFLLLAVWAAFKEKNGLLFLVPGAALALMADRVADSRTGLMCTLLFMIAVLADHLSPHLKMPKVRKAAGIAMCMAFPALAVITNALVLAYRHGVHIALKINELMSDRLALSSDALSKYGISLLGQKADFTGWGGTTLAKPGYDYVDISYVLILIRFGIIALVMISVLWVLMTRRALKTGNLRLAAVLTLIALNSAAEHHIMSLYYDIYLAMPFAILAVRGKEETGGKAEAEEKGIVPGWQKSTAVYAGVAAALAVLASALALALLPEARTVITLMHTDDRPEGKFMLLLVIAAGLFFAAVALFCAYKLITGLVLKHGSGRKKQLAAIAAFAAAVVVVVAGCNLIINKGADRKADIVDSESSVIETVQASKSGKLYVTDMPEIYQKKYGGISSSLFNGEELARYRNISVISDLHLDSPCYFNRGFLYTPVSDKHSLYTNDEEVIKALQKEGFHLTGYFPLEYSVDMEDLADRNDLEQNEDGSITLHGEKDTIRKGPRADLREGRYTVTYDLALEPAPAAGDNSEACRLVTTYYKGEYQVNETVITKDMFDDNGEYTANVIVEMPDAENTDFCVYPAGDSSVTVKSISYKKTPEYDIHSVYDKNDVKVREEYYDLDGVPYDQVAGYFARDLEYDDYGNINHEVYYDSSGSKTLIAAGYCEVRKTYDDLHHVLREEYYGTDGKRIALRTGQSAVESAYDSAGHQTEVRFYGVNDEPVEIGEENRGGYHKVARVYDGSGRIIREDYFDTDGKPAVLKEGFFSKAYEYDEAGNIISEKYFDLDNKPVLCSNGYAEVRREFDNFGRVTVEKYCGTDGEQVSLPTGQASVRYMYDERGLISEMSFYDAEGLPALVEKDSYNGYQKVKLKYDELGRLRREDFYDAEGKPTLVRGGYASREPIYHDTSNLVFNSRYYDVTGKEIFFKH